MLWPNFQDTQQGTKNAKDDANTTNMYYDKDITFLSLKKSCTYTQMFCESKDNCGVAGGQKRKKKTKGKKLSFLSTKGLKWAELWICRVTCQSRLIVIKAKSTALSILD